MTRRRSSPLGLELVVSVVLALVVLPLFSHGAPVQDAHAELQRYSEGCYYNYNHYSEGDRILTNEPCLNCTCHNKMLMCYLRVCPFTKPIGHDCTVEKREDQCCPIITCPEVPVDVGHHVTQLTTNAPGTELSILEKYGCNIDNKFFAEGALLPSNPNKPCELCYCIRNHTSCLMQECTLHIDGCQPIYNKGSCCPVRYNCDHENELLELEDFSTTTTTVRPTPGYILTSTTSPVVSTDCVHNNEVYADGSSITGKNACEHCYCMRGDIVCAVQECEVPTLESGAKTCRALPPLSGECCPSNYVCEDDAVLPEGALLEGMITTIAPKIPGDLHESVSHEDVELQEHIDDKIAVTDVPEKDEEHLDIEHGSEDDKIAGQAPGTTIAPIVGETAEPSADEDKKSEEKEKEEDVSPITTTVSAIKEAGYETTQSPIDITATQKTEEGLDVSHIIIDQDKEYDSTKAPVAQDVITDENEAPVTAAPGIGEKEKEDEAVPSKEDELASGQDITTSSAESSSEEEEIEKDVVTTASPIGLSKPEQSKEEDIPAEQDQATISPIAQAEVEEAVEPQATVSPSKEDITPEISVEDEQPSTPSSLAPSKAHFIPDTSAEEEQESSSESAELPVEAPTKPAEGQDKTDKIESSTSSPIYEMVTEGEDGDMVMPEIADHKAEAADFEKKPKGEVDISVSPLAPALSGVDSETKDELPQVPVERTTISAVIGEKEESATSRPSSEEAVSSTEAEQTPSDMPTTSGPNLEEDIEGAIEDSKKPISEEYETPAVVQEITETSGKPISEAIPKGEDEIKDQTTVLPPKESGVEEVSESEESQEEQTSSEEGEVQSTESSEDAQKEIVKATTAVPIEVSVVEDASTSTPLKDSAIDSKAPQGEKEKEVKDKSEEDSTSVVPSLTEVLSEMSEGEDSQEQSEEEVSGLTTSRPIVADSKVTITGIEKDKEGVKPSLDEPTTVVPSLTDIEGPSSEEDKIEAMPGKEPIGSAPETPVQEGIDFKVESDSELPSEISTVTPSKDLITETSTEIPSDKDVTIVTSSVADTKEESSTEEISEQQEKKPTSEEELKEKPAQGIKEPATDVPSLADMDLPISQEEEAEEDEIKGKPESGAIDSTTISAESEQTTSEEEEEIEGQKKQGIIDSTTTIPSAAELPIQVETEDKKQEAPIAPSVEKDSESSSTEEEEKNKQQPEQDIADLTTLAPVAESEGLKPTKEQAEGDSTTVIPPVAGVAEQSEKEKEHVKEQPEINLLDITTLSPSVSAPKVPVVLEEDLGGVAAITTVAPSAAGSEAESEEQEEGAKEQPEQDTADITTISPSISDSELPSSEKDKAEEEPDRGIIDSTSALPIIPDLFEPVDEKEEQIKEQYTTVAPAAIDSELPSSEIDESKPEQVDIRRTTLSPISSSGEESSEVIEAGEGSGEQPNGIVPPAIPGEGDCLVNDKTYANNATIPTANECELSCRCASSIVVCQRVQCYEPPQPNNCVLDESSTDKCCPQYICGVDSFAEDQRPTTPEDVEDEEISFTTLPPVKKYPVVSSEPGLDGEEPVKPAATTGASVDKSEEIASEEEAIDVTTRQPEEESIKPVSVDSDESILKPGQEDVPAKTEQPALPEEVATPSSVDIEMPVVSPDVPMSHVKGEAGQDESTELSSSSEGSGDEDISTEKPQILDTEAPIPAAVPEAEIPSKKPEESTTFKAAEEQESATISPLAPEVSAVDDSVTIDTQTELAEPQDVTTKSPIDIFGNQEVIESVSSTTKPVDAASEAPSLSSVLGSQEMDSSQSEESEGPEQGSSESAEELEETTKPTAVKEEEASTTTASSIPAEQSTVKTIHTDLAGEIKPFESSTIIPEVEYQKPEMPEDLSHTKVEDVEVEKETKKPAPPVIAEDSDESEETTEKTLEIIPPETPVSTILTPVVPVEKEEDKIYAPAVISDKKDDFAAIVPKGEDQSTEQISIEQSKPLYPALTPSASGEEPLPGTIAPASVEESEEKKDQSSIPAVVGIPVAPVMDEKSEEDMEEIPSHTSAPAVADQTLPGTVAPISEEESEEEKEDVPSKTSAPVIAEQPTFELIPSVSEEENELILSQTSAPAVVEQTPPGTVAPILEKESEEEKEEVPTKAIAPVFPQESEGENILSQTSAPVVTDQPPVLEDESHEDKEDILSQTSAPSITEKPISGPIVSIPEEENEDILSQTSAPSVAEPTPSGTVAPISAEESDEDKEEDSQTSAPGITGQPISGPVAPVLEEESEEANPSQTSAPVKAEQALPGTVAPALEDESEEVPSQTNAPAPDSKPISGDVAPIPEEESGEEQEDIISQTSAPTVTDQALPETVAPVLEEDSEEKISSQTSAPGIAQQPLSGAQPAEESEEEKIPSQTSAPAIDKKIIEEPIAGGESEEKEDEIARPTAAPVLEVGNGATSSEDKTEQTSSQTIAPSVEEPIESGSPVKTGLESEEESEDGLGTTPASGEQPQSTSSSSESELEDEKEEIATQTLAPGQKLDDSIIAKPAQTTASPAVEEADISLSTVSSSEEDEAVISETSAPTVEDKKPSVQEDEYDANIFSSTPSSVEGVEAEDEDLAPTDKPQGAISVEPVKSSDEETDANATPVPSKPVKDGAIKDEHLDLTEVPVSGDITEAPIKSIEKEDEVSDFSKPLSPVDLATEAVPTSQEDESLEGTPAPPSIAQTPESESALPVYIPVSEEKEVEGTTQLPTQEGFDSLPSKADRGTEEELSTKQPIEGEISDDKQEQPEKTLLQSESPQVAGETISPLSVEGMTGEKIEQPATELISFGTDKPASIESDSSSETESPISSTGSPVVPEVVVIDEVTSQPAMPDSEDQVSVDKVSLDADKPSADDVPTPTESSLGEKPSESAEKEQSSQESSTEEEKPSPVVKVDSGEILTETEKPKETEIPSVVTEKDIEVPSAVVEKESEIQPVESETPISEEEMATVQTDSPISVPSIIKVQEPEAVEVPVQTEQPGSLEGSAEGPVDEQVIQESPVKPAVEISTSESEEGTEKEISSTVTPIDLVQPAATPASEAPVAPAESESSSSDASEEESGQTEAPKIQTVAEFVSERGDELTTSIPILDTKKEEIPQQPIVPSSEETSTTSSEEEEEDDEVEPEVPTTAQKLAPGIAAENESEETTQAPDVVPPVVSEEEQKLEEPTSEKPIVPVDNKFDTEISKPVDAIKESSAEEEEAPVLLTTAHPLFPSIELDRTTLRPMLNASDKVDDEVPISGTTARPVYVPSSTPQPPTEQSTTAQAVTSVPTSNYQQPTYGHVPPQYPSYTEDEYTDEDETVVFGPGTCRYGGKLFVSAQQIPRDDPCDFCFCFRSDIICLQQSCPPPISGCHEEPINGFCCPRYECPVSMATVLNITTSTTTTSTTLPPHFLHHAYRGAAEKNGCHISGKSYRVGDKIDSASGPCMHCTCGGDGQMKCDPKTCSPEPMLRQMIAVVASRRR